MGSTGDDYEKQFMAGGSAIARSRVRMPTWFFAILVLPLLALIVTAVATLQPTVLAVAAIEIPLLIGIALVFSHLRATVTPTHFHVQYGLWGPKVPLDRIERVVLEEYDWMRYGGWGLRRGRNGVWAYTVPGSGSTVLRIEHRDEAGKLKAFVVSVDDPAAMLLAIEKARAAAGRGVRVETKSDAVAQDEDVQSVEAASSAAERSKPVDRT